MKRRWFESVCFSPESGAGNGAESASTPPGTNDLIDFDPFEPGNGPGEAGTTTAQPSDTPTLPGEATTTQGDALPPATAPATAPPTPPHDPVQAQLASIAELLATRERQDAAARERQSQPTTPAGPRFNFEVPQAVTAAIASEVPEERAQGMNALVNGLANSLYGEIAREFSEREAKILQAIPRMAEATHNTARTQQELAQDFYGKYADLGTTPEMRQFVQLTAQQLARELQTQGRPLTGWTAEFRDAVATRAYSGLGRQVPQMQAPTPPATNGRQPRPASFATGAAASRGGQPVAPSKEIADLWATMDY